MILDQRTFCLIKEYPLVDIFLTSLYLSTLKMYKYCDEKFSFGHRWEWKD